MYNTIIETITATLADYEKTSNPQKIWKKPLAKIIPANDIRLGTLKEAVSAEHFLPHDILPEAKSIISFFIPFQESVVKSNISGAMASEEWSEAYVKTNELIAAINERIETLMEQNGHKAGKIPATHNFEMEKLISNWSHRHIAHIAGLGTFGINNMLITEDGCCGRIGSIIISQELEAYAPRRPTEELCLNKRNGSCGICQKKCDAGAFENSAYNRHKCYDQCLKNAEYHKKTGYADVCGKCLVGLPCSTKKP